MLDDELVELLGDYLAETYRAVDKHYLELLGRQIREIGTVGPTGLHQLQQMMRAGADIDAITREIADITGRNAEGIARILEQAAQSAYGDAAPYYEARNISQAPLAANPALLNTIRAIEVVTLQTFANLSQTTAVRQSYSKAIDSAVAAVQSGVTDYNKAIRGALREAAKEGLRVEYASGHTRRLDSAVRQNVLDGVRASNQGVRDETGRQFGADGVEIQAHGMSAPDHEPHQGRQYSKKEFAALQGSLPRPIGMWNCGHAVFPIILGVSAPNYTSRELREMWEENHKPVTYHGRTYATKYEASQQQRRMETAIRYGEDVAHLADAAGDTALAAEYRAKLKVLNREYRDFSGAAGLQTRRDRIQAARQRFASGGGGGTMGASRAVGTVKPIPITDKAIQGAAVPRGKLMDEARYKATDDYAKQVLRAAQGEPLGTEVAITAAFKDGGYLGTHFGPPAGNRVKVLPEAVDYIMVHNHPDGQLFSLGDMQGFARNNTMRVMAAIGNDGHGYLVEKVAGYDGAKLSRRLAELEPAYMKDPIATMNTLFKGADKYGIYFVG